MNDEQLALYSYNAQSEINNILELQRSGQIVEATHKAQALLAQSAECAATFYVNFQLAIVRQDYQNAEKYLNDALVIEPTHPVLLLSKAQLHLKRYRFSSAVDNATQAVSLYQGTNIAFLSAAAELMLQAETPAAATVVYQRILTLSPKNLQAMHQLALCYFFSNQIEQAAALLNHVIIMSPANAGAVHLRSALQTYTASFNHTEELKKLIAKKPHPAVYYALAKELEDIGEYKQSFSILQQGASLMRKSISYNEIAELSAIKDIISSTSTWAAEPIETSQKDGPIFIVGMPRTGTTLVERILLQHDNVYPLGEFSLFPQLLSVMANEHLQRNRSSTNNLHDAALQLDFAELGRRYMEAAIEVSGGNTQVIDKLPVNFLYCGFIKKAIPNARIIHLSRNTMDSCYAIYKTLFINAYSFSYDFNELANYYAIYQKVMAHWHKTIPGQILDIKYEALVSTPTETATRLCEWCGLTFKSELLDFHKAAVTSTTASAAQIRRPIYTSSVEKWRYLETELAPLQQALVKAGAEI